MAGVDAPKEKIPGFKYYNSVTPTGRAGGAVITLGAVTLGILYLVLKPKKK